MSLTELRYAMAIESVPEVLTVSALQSSHDFKDSDDGVRVWATTLSRGLLEFKFVRDQYEDHTPISWTEATAGSVSHPASSPPNSGERNGTWTVRPNHQTVKDFVTAGGLLQLEDVSCSNHDESAKANYLIMKSCIRYLAAKEVQLALVTVLQGLGPSTKAFVAALENTEPTALLLELIEQDKEFESAARPHLKGEAYPTKQDSMFAMIDDEIGGEMLDDFPFLQFAVTTWIAHAEHVERSTWSKSLSELVELFQWPLTRLTSFWSIMSWVVGYTCAGVFKYNADLENLTLLHLAAKFGLTSTVKRILLDQKLFGLDSKAEDYVQSAWKLAIKTGNEAIVRLFLEAAKIDLTDDIALLSAVTGNHTEIVRLLLRYMEVNSNYNEQASDGGPISWAVHNNREDVLKLLLDDGRFATNIMNDSGRSPLHEAAWLCHEKILRILLGTNNMDVNARDSDGNTALLLVVGAGINIKYSPSRLASVEVLLGSRDIDLELHNSNGRTPLHVASQHSPEVVKLLIGSVNLGAIAMDGQTPLHVAAKYSLEVAKLLIDSGKVNLDSIDGNHQTPLHIAAEYSLKVAKLLVDSGKVDLDSVDGNGRTILHVAAAKGLEAVANLLINSGKVNLNSVDGNGQTPLHVAAYYGHIGTVKLLLGRCANTELTDGLGRTALLIAAYRHDKLIAEELLRHGAELRARCKKGWNALFYAIGCGEAVNAIYRDAEDMISLLESFIKAGLGTDHLDNDGRTVLSYAKEFESEFAGTSSRWLADKYRPVVQFLEQCGNVIRVEGGKEGRIGCEKEVGKEVEKDDGKEDGKEG